MVQAAQADLDEARLQQQLIRFLAEQETGQTRTMVKGLTVLGIAGAVGLGALFHSQEMNYESCTDFTVYTDHGPFGVSFHSNGVVCAVSPNGRKTCRHTPEMLGQGWEAAVAIVGIISACIGGAATVYGIVQNAKAERRAREAQAEVAAINAQIVAIQTETQQIATEAQSQQTEQQSMLTKTGVGVSALPRFSVSGWHYSKGVRHGRHNARELVPVH